MLSFAEHLQVIDSLQTSSGNSTGSESELVEVMQTMSTGHLKEFGMSKKPKRRKNTRKRRPSLRHQNEPDENLMGKYCIKGQSVILMTLHTLSF